MRLESIALALLLALSISCRTDGGDGDGDADADADADADGDADADADGDCVEEACHAAPFTVASVTGTVVDGAGRPAEAQPVAVCSAGRCYMGAADAEGVFTVALSGGETSEVAIYFPGEAHSSPFCAFTELCDGDIELCHRFELHPAATSGTAVPEEALTEDLRIEGEGGAALVLPAGALVLLPIGAAGWLTLERFDLDEYLPCFLDPEDPPLALYHFTPMDALVMEPDSMIDPLLLPAGLDLPNDLGLAAGAVVDVAVVGGAHALDADLREGELAELTTATVTSDGARIQTAPGQGIGYLTWVALFAR